MSKKDETLIRKLGYVLKEARINKDYTRAQFSERIGISERHLTSIENGERRPSFELLYSIIRNLGISADQIFYPDLEESGAEHVKRLYNICSERDKKIIKALIDSMLDSK